MGSKRYTDEQIIENARNVKSMTDLLKLLGLCCDGGNSFNSIKKKIIELNIDISHWIGQGWSKDLYLKSIEDYKSKTARRNYLISVRGNKCEICNTSEWCGKQLSIEVHHIDGNNKNNQIENLQLLCPNCHSLTPNFRNKSRTGVLKKSIIKKKKCTDCDRLCSISSIRCNSCASKDRCKTINKCPSYEQLYKDIVEFKNNKSAIGRKYGVSDNAVRKWIKKM